MSIQNTISFFSRRRDMWTELLEGLEGPLSNWKDAARKETERFSDLKTDARVLGQLTKMAIDQRMTFAPSVRLDAYGELELPDRIKTRNQLREQLDNPLGETTLSAYQESISGKMWKKYTKAIQDGDSEKARKALNRSFTGRKYWYAFMNPAKYHQIAELEQHMERAKAQIVKHAKSYKAVAGMDKSILAEQKEVAKTLAKMGRKGRFQEMIEIIGPEAVSKDHVLQTISDILEHSPNMKEKEIFAYLKTNEVDINHPLIFESINTANTAMTEKIKEGKKSVSRAQERAAVITDFQKKLKNLIRRETQMTVDGKSQPLTDLLQAMEDGNLDQATADRLSQRVSNISDTWAMNPTIEIVREAAEIMTKPNFDIEDLPSKRLEHALRVQHMSYMGMRVREGLKSVSDWSKHASEIFSARAKQTMTSVREMLREPIGIFVKDTRARFFGGRNENRDDDILGDYDTAVHGQQGDMPPEIIASASSEASATPDHRGDPDKPNLEG